MPKACTFGTAVTGDHTSAFTVELITATATRAWASGAANGAEEMALPLFRFHKLTGDRRGTYSVTVKANWRVTFRFYEGAAHDVDLEDYH